MMQRQDYASRMINAKNKAIAIYAAGLGLSSAAQGGTAITQLLRNGLSWREGISRSTSRSYTRAAKTMHEFAGTDSYMHLRSSSRSIADMLEAGISTVAVNLPSLWHLCTKVAPAHARDSLGGLLSPTSIRSIRWSKRWSKQSDETSGSQEKLAEPVASNPAGSLMHLPIPQGFHCDLEACQYDEVEKEVVWQEV
ncbi:hypothetical protein ANO11243_019100 [Dothideomycetidae sp. 11243]|nr:hypothetical protein ANO11243_019100 [fungal sp. No.11243]